MRGPGGRVVVSLRAAPEQRQLLASRWPPQDQSPVAGEAVPTDPTELSVALLTPVCTKFPSAWMVLFKPRPQGHPQPGQTHTLLHSMMRSADSGYVGHAFHHTMERQIEHSASRVGRMPGASLRKQLAVQVIHQGVSLNHLLARWILGVDCGLRQQPT